MDLVLIAIDADVVVDVRATDTAGATATDTVLAIDTDALREIAPSGADTRVFCCVACNAGDTNADAVPNNARLVMDTHELSTLPVVAELRS